MVLQEENQCSYNVYRWENRVPWIGRHSRNLTPVKCNGRHPLYNWAWWDLRCWESFNKTHHSMNITRLIELDLNSGIWKEKYTHPNNAAIAAKRLQLHECRAKITKNLLVSSGRIHVTHEKKDRAWTIAMWGGGELDWELDSHRYIPGRSLWNWVSNETGNNRLELTPQKGRSKDVSEKPFAADTSVGSDTCILLRMQSVEQGAVDEVYRPNHGWRLDQETP